MTSRHGPLTLIRKLFISLTLSLSAVPLLAGAQSRDTVEIDLQTVEVKGNLHRRLFKTSTDGSTSISRQALVALPQLMGNVDPIKALQALPAVSSGGDIGGGLYVQGCSSWQNYISINSVRVINPMHMLGIFSVFNTPHFDSFQLSPVPYASSPDIVGSCFSASNNALTDTVISLEATAGLIDSHATLRLPLRSGGSSLTLSGRATYVDLLFGNALAIDHSQLHYGFQDINATYTSIIGSSDYTLQADILYSHDRLRLEEEGYSADGRLGWHNLAAGLSLANPRWSHQLSVSAYGNRFDLQQGGNLYILPSSVTMLEEATQWSYKEFTCGWDGTVAWFTPQYDKNRYSPLHTHSFSAAIYGAIDWPISSWLTISPGLRLSYYSSGGFNRPYPLPHLDLSVGFTRWLKLGAGYCMVMQPTHFIKESGAGLPTDYIVNASRVFKPQTAQAFHLNLNGVLPWGYTFTLGGYYRSLRHITEYDGSILNMVNAGYDPLSDLRQGNGRTYGFTAMMAKVEGPLTATLSYTLSRAEGRFEDLNDYRWIPLSHDRRHDLSLTLTWHPRRELEIGATGVYATGFPFTEASMGYMIGENLIFEYYPHNSSRLPAYKRIDLGAGWTFNSRERLKHKVNLSFYNLLGWHNVLFSYVSYSPEHGVRHRQSKMKLIIPSISYTISL